jgi:hypothetical protein
VARINVVAWRNRAGLGRDARILEGLLRDLGHEVVASNRGPPSLPERLRYRRRTGRPRLAVNLFLETAIPQWFGLARHNVLIPNPEWLTPGPWLDRLGAVWCKSRVAVETLRPLHANTRHLGFTGVDRLAEPVVPAGGAWHPLHIVGQSDQKGTRAILRTWARHPDWPVLTVVAWAEGLQVVDDQPPNTRLVAEYLDDQALRELQTGSLLHLCPSEAEGFGHSLVEGMSCGALVVTTDAPPMNELVSRDRGVLVPWRGSEPMRQGRRYFVDEDALERALAGIFASSPARWSAHRAAARAWYEANDAEFRQRFAAELAALLGPPT